MPVTYPEERDSQYSPLCYLGFISKGMNLLVVQYERCLHCGLGFVLVFYKISLNWLQIYISVFKSMQSIHFFLIFVCLNEDSHWSGPNLNSLNKRQINWVAQGAHLATSTIHWQKKR